MTAAPPLWTRVGFAWAVAATILGLAVLSVYKAALYANLDVPPLQRHRPDTAMAVVFLVLGMLLVCGAIVVPLVIRARSQRRTGP